jgi:dTMP kinase
MLVFVAIEGLDGAGTTSQVTRLVAWLDAQGRRAHRTFEPSDGPIGRLIRQTLKSEPGAPHRSILPWMFAADRADHLYREIEPKLSAGVAVITDRYYHSSLAYQSMEIPLPQVWELNRTFRQPDLTVFVRIDVDTALARIASRNEQREIFEQRNQLERISSHYDQVLDFLTNLGHPIAEVDGAGSLDAVTAAVRAEVARVL